MPRRWPMFLGFALGFTALLAGLRSGSDMVEGWRLAARWTARVGFPMFLVTYSASSMGRLWHTPLTRTIWRDRRWWGLGFFASHTIHLGALVTFLRISGESRPLSVIVGGGLAYVLLFAMAATSNAAAMRALGHNWRRLHTLGIHTVWFVFAFSYFGRLMKPDSMMTGLIGTALALGALGLRVAVWLKGRSRSAAVSAII